MFRKCSLFVLSFFLFKNLFAQQIFTLHSPNNKLSTTIKLGKEGVFYKVSLNRETLMDYSLLKLKFSKDFLVGSKMVKPVFLDTVEHYYLQTGKRSEVFSASKIIMLPLKNDNFPSLIVNLVFRAFDDGIAFRYEMIGPLAETQTSITDEHIEFHLNGNPMVKALELPNFTSSHEGFYTTATLDNIEDNKLIDMPALFRFSDHAYMAITEAALLNYAGMYLIKKNGQLQTTLSPLPSDTGVKAKVNFPFVTPWRVMLISDKMGDLLASSMLTTLSPDCKIGNTSWIRPGTTTFPWWNGNVTPDTLNAPGNNFVTQQYYIDFCARNHIAYHTIVEYGLHQWYTDDGTGFQPGPHADVTTPVPGLDIKEVCDYAHSKGVGVRVWVHWKALYPKLDSAFAIFERWGLSGMMIDFMDRDDQEMVNMQTEMLEKAAKHHLHIQFHGAYKPTGLSRTYPNEMTREGTLNYEVNKWGPALPPSHDLDVAFTRLIAGATDYHLGGFRAVPPDQYRAQYTRPLMLGTRCHMMAMYVVLENALSMVCDYPAAYEGQDGFEFITSIPTTWDQTVVPIARVGECLVIARKKNNTWYIGSINNDTTRTITIHLDFLGAKNYEATIYSDSENAATDPDKIKKQKRSVTNTTQLTITLAGGGGAVIIIEERPGNTGK